MQFHLNGFRPGDPAVTEASERGLAAKMSALPALADVVIVGCGPAGLTLAAQLSAFPDIHTVIVEQKPGPLQVGQADGIMCRTMEMFEAFGFAGRVLQESCWITETSFWKPDEANKDHIVRQGRIQDTEDGLSEFPHVILNQARVHDYYLEIMRNAPNRLEPHYSRRLVDVTVDTSPAAGSHPVTARFEWVDGDLKGQVETIKARYAVGCDGARSGVRQSLGRTLQGDSASQAWGVMDVLAVTTFPDVRMKALIQSAGEGSIVLIPREGGYMFRIYVELDKLNPNERVSARNITIDRLIAAAQRIFRPYTLDVKEVAWWSVYEIGQRLCDKFDDVPAADIATRLPHVFIAGDACHTHSPKAGQGMNVSMQDGFNLGWKLAAVLQGRSPPSLLHSYSAERQAIAAELIDFDRAWSKMLSAPLKSAAHPDGKTPADVQRYFVQHGRYTAGTATRYQPSVLTAEADYQNLATGLVVGMRFHSTPVVRLADAKPQRLGDTLKADGRWRLMMFSDRKMTRMRALCDFLSTSPQSPLRAYTPAKADVDSVIDVRCVLQQSHLDLDLNAMPELLRPAKGRYGLTDYEKMFCPDFKAGIDIFDQRGIDRDQGCVVVVRPDQYIAHVLPLDATAELSAFFGAFMLRRA
jgi:phenol 2-monooxygenase (NADPH)